MWRHGERTASITLFLKVIYLLAQKVMQPIWYILLSPTTQHDFQSLNSIRKKQNFGFNCKYQPTVLYTKNESRGAKLPEIQQKTVIIQLNPGFDCLAIFPIFTQTRPDTISWME